MFVTTSFKTHFISSCVTFNLDEASNDCKCYIDLKIRNSDRYVDCILEDFGRFDRQEGEEVEEEQQRSFSIDFICTRCTHIYITLLSNYDIPYEYE